MIQINLNNKDIRRRLCEILKLGGCNHPELISEIIINNLEKTEKGLGQLVIAFAGIRETCEWIIGDEALLKTEHVYSWETNLEKMKEAGFLDGEFIKVIVTEVDLTKKRSISIEYDGMSDKGVVKKVAGDVNPEYLERRGDLKLARTDISELL